MRFIYLFPLCAMASLNMALAQPDYFHAEEKIGTVRQVYDGVLMPDIQANTFRNIDRLFSTSTVKHGSAVYQLPVSDTPLTSLEFSSPDSHRSRY